ncbi:MAG TPA: HD domain-containing phosphohydrolase [Ktedonobacteraceae bacterium]
MDRMPNQSRTSDRASNSLAELLCALSFATGLGFGGHIEHGLGSASLGLHLADVLELPAEEREAVFYGALLKDVGCTACSAGLAAFWPDAEEKPAMLSDVILIDPSKISEMLGWLSTYLRPDVHLPQRLARLVPFLLQCGPIVRELMRSHCEVAELFARQLGFPEDVQLTLRFQWERWDGKGMAYGLKAEAIPRPARLLHLAQVLDLSYRFGGPETTRAMALEKRGTRFDPVGVDAFLRLVARDDFWSEFEAQTTQSALLARCPATRARQIEKDRVEQVCEVLGDFIDLKTREDWHHSRAVAEIALEMGQSLGLPAGELRKLRCSALVHDLGKAALPIGILTKGTQRSESEEETFRLHPHYTQRILERVEALRDLVPAAASHHEWVDGRGYHRQLSGEQIPLHGRVLAVANVYARHLQLQGGQPNPAEILRVMHAGVGSQFDSACYDALARVVSGQKGEAVLPAQSKRDNLTEREREILRLLVQGHNTPQIARILTISKKTVEHHLTHIYTKIGVSSRTAAVIYAVQQGLI